MRASGFTLVELLVAMTVFGIVMTATMGAIVAIQRSYVSQRERARAKESLRAAQMTIATALRGAGADPTRSGLTFLDPDPLGRGRFDNIRVVSDFNPPDGDVDDLLEDIQIWIESDTLFARWQSGGQQQPLMFPALSLMFEYYANDGTLLTDPVQVVGATRVQFTLEAQRDPRRGTTERLESSWIYLRNR